MQLQGRTALIAGAGRNNGKAIAMTFAREGADLILVSRQREDELKQVARDCESMGVKTLALLADISNHEEAERAVKNGLARFGKVDTLVSVAAIRPHKNFWDFSNEEWLQVFDLNLHSTFYLSKAVVPGMKERKSGNIIALGGMASLTSETLGSAVVASKHGLYGLIKSLALELGPYGIRANLLAPAHINNKRLNPEWYANRVGEEVANTMGGDPSTSPLKRTGTAQEVANCALFLASDQSSYITGDRMFCGGGRYM